MNEHLVQVTFDKLNTCKHRSAEEQVRIIKRCACQGGNFEQRGYFCNAKQIFNVTQEICQGCQVYESK